MNDNDGVEPPVLVRHVECITGLESDLSADADSVAQQPGRLDEGRRKVDCRYGARKSRSDLAGDATNPTANVENLGLWAQVERVQQRLGREIPAEVELIDTPQRSRIE